MTATAMTATAMTATVDTTTTPTTPPVSSTTTGPATSSTATPSTATPSTAAPSTDGAGYPNARGEAVFLTAETYTLTARQVVLALAAHLARFGDTLHVQVVDPLCAIDAVMRFDGADLTSWTVNRTPTEAATKQYNEDMKASMPQTIWVSGCSSWYLGRDGLPELFPWPPERHQELLASPEADDFDVRTA